MRWAHKMLQTCHMYLVAESDGCIIKASPAKWTTHVSQCPVMEVCADKKNNLSFLSDFWQTNVYLMSSWIFTMWKRY